MAEQEKDRTEPATPFKLEEAKHRGQVSKSLDFISLVMLSAFLAALYAWADDLARFGLRLSVGALESGAELAFTPPVAAARSEEHTSELQSRRDLVCRLLLEK